MRIVSSIGLSLSSRTAWQDLCPNGVSWRWTQVRHHGRKRTLSTPHYSPVNWMRERTRVVRRSLYHHEEDWTPEPVYPEIVPVKHTKDWVKYTRRQEARRLEQLSLKEKMRNFAFAPPWKFARPKEEHWDFRRRFWRPFELTGFPVLYNVTPFYQYITNTAVVSDQLPADYYSFLDEAALTGLVEQIRQPVIQALLAERRFYSKNLAILPEDDRTVVIQAQNVIDAITRTVDLAAGKDFPHLHELQRDLETKCAAYWKRSGYDDKAWNGEFTKCPISGEVKFQYVEEGNVFRLFRHELPLPEVVSRDPSSTLASTDAASNVPLVNESPAMHGFKRKQYIPHWVPGFWFGDPCEYSTLSLTVPRKWTALVDRIDEEAAFENLTGNAIMSGFGRIVAQAMFLGFSLLNELTYPIVTQSILTNGRDWVFSTYQANTIAVWKVDSDNPHRNLAWITKPLRLFERIDDDAVVGLNEDVLKNIIRQYLKAPSANPNLRLRPFVGEPVRSYWKNELSRAPFYHRTVRRDGKPRAPYKPEI